MNLYNKINELNAIAQARVNRKAEEAELEQMLARAEHPRKTPVLSKGLEFTTEGAASLMAGASELDVVFELPARQVGWDLEAGRYRAIVKVAAPALITARSGDMQVMNARRVADEAVLDFDQGKVMLESTTAVVSLRLFRFDQLAESELIIGPFETDGVVRARAVGSGSWNVAVASDYVINRGLDLHTGLVGTGDLQVWRGRSRSPVREIDPVSEERRLFVEGTRYSDARVFGDSLPALHWAPGVECGKVYHAEEDLNVQSTGRYPHVEQGAFGSSGYDYWGGLGEWVVLGAYEAPSFDPVPGYWTYLWGACSGHVKAYDVRTGRLADPSTPGFYIVKAASPDEVTISGVHASEPSARVPLSRLSKERRYEDRRVIERGEVADPHTGARTEIVLQPGRYKKLSWRTNPQGFFIRVRGTGTLKAVEISIAEHDAGPRLEPLTRIWRESLSQYWEPGDAPRENDTTGLQERIVRSGQGVRLVPRARQHIM